MSLARPTVNEVYGLDQSRYQREEREQEEYEKNFFARVRLHNKVFKTTYSHRLDDLNRAINELLPRNTPLQLMDVAISSGISTQEWIDGLISDGIDFHMVAGDISLNAFIVSVARNVQVLVDKRGYPVHIDLCGQGIDLSSAKIPRVASFVIRGSITRLLALDTPIIQYIKGRSENNESRFGLQCAPIMLVSPRLKKNANLELVEDDVTANVRPELQERFHAIRAANILNRSYFEPIEIRTILMNLKQRLRKNGLLAICRTTKDGENHGTILSLNETGRFQALMRIGQGSEVEESALDLDR